MLNTPNRPKINPTSVRYIKLGEGGVWEQECLANETIRFGFWTGDPETMQLCRQARWGKLAESWKQNGRSQSTATRFTNETRLFFEDQGDTLWLTFIGERLYWGFLTTDTPEPSGDGDSSWRKVDGGWKSTDIFGEGLTKSRLSGAITKLAAYRGTSCRVDVARQIIARINGEKSVDVENAIGQIAGLRTALLPLIRSLGPKDFELLVDLIFTTSGWRRIGAVGSTQKTLDIDMELPTTGERAFVQVKSRTNQQQYREYVLRKQTLDTHNRMFFVFHTGTVTAEESDSILIGPDQLPGMVLNAGLTEWLIQKVS